MAALPCANLCTCNNPGGGSLLNVKHQPGIVPCGILSPLSLRTQWDPHYSAASTSGNSSSRVHTCLKWQRNLIKGSSSENDFAATATNTLLANFQCLSLTTAPDLQLGIKRVEATLLDYQPPVSHNCSSSEPTKTNQIRPNVSACQRCPLGAK